MAEPPDLAVCWKETALHTAVRLSDHEAIGRRASSRGQGAHAPDAIGWTPLHLAAVLDADEAIALLLSNGARIDGLSDDGRTPLALAAATGSARAVRRLLALGARLSVPGEARPVLADASLGRSLEVVDALAAAGATTSEELPYLVMALRLSGRRVWLGAKGYSRGVDEQPDLWRVDREMRLPWSLLAPIGWRPDETHTSPSAAEWVEPRATFLGGAFARVEVSGEDPGDRAGDDLGDPAFAGPRCASVLLRQERLGEVAVTEDLLLETLDKRTAVLELPRALIALLELAGLDPRELAHGAPAIAGTMFARTMSQGSPALLGALLAAGVSPDLRDALGRTPLMIAAGWGLGAAVETLLQYHADPSLLDPRGRTAAAIAVASGEGTLAERLSGAPGDSPPDPSVVGAQMVEALREYDGARLKELLERHGLVSLAAAGASPARVGLLALAAARGQEAHVRALLAAGADPNELSPDGQRPLHRAAGRHPSLLRALIEAGADVAALTSSGDTALHLEVDRPSGFAGDGIEVLLAAGADPLARDGSGRTPLERFHPSIGRHARQILEVATQRAQSPDPVLALWPTLAALIEGGGEAALLRFLEDYPEAARNPELAERAWACCSERGRWRVAKALFVGGFAVPADPRAALIDRHPAISDFLPGHAALVLAAQAAGGPERVKFLLDAIRLEGRDEAAMIQAALFEAVSRDAAAGSAACLIQAGAGVDVRAKDALAATLERLGLDRTLAGLGHDPTLRTTVAATAMGRAHPELVALCASLAEAPDDTPLMFAVSSDALPDLIAAGADVHMANGVGRNVLHRLALQAFHPEVNRDAHHRQLRNLDLLLAAGAPLNAVDTSGFTPLDLCRASSALRARFIAQGAVSGGR